MALWNQSQRKELTWPGRNTGDIQMLDYQFPLQAYDTDTGIGEVDLIGVTDRGQLTVIEAKVLNNSSNDTPLYALVESLRYTAIVQANLETIIEEAKKRWDIIILDEPPILQLIAPKSWWEFWINPKSRWPKTRGKKGEWEQNFKVLLANIEEELGIVTECFALKDLTMKCIEWKDPDEKRPEIQPNPFDCLVLIGEKEPYANPIAK